MRATAGVALVMLATAWLNAGAQAVERRDVRVIYDFECGNDLEEVKKFSENGAYDIVQDNGVTGGKNCLRVVGTPKDPWVAFDIRGEKAKDWGKFDYFAMDVFVEREQKLTIVFELWDGASKNYATRCTYEDVQTHVGKNTLVWKMNRAARNNKKEGRDWHEMQPQDKIDMNNLSRVKIFFSPFKDGGNTVIWIDKLRIMQEDAVVPKIDIALPEGAKAYDFGGKGTLVAGFTHVGAGSPGLSGQGVKEDGKAWPDPLTGDGLESATGAFQFDVEVPDGEYWVWLSAGRVIDEKTRQLPFQLSVGDQKLCDETVSEADFYGEKGVFRHLRTQYSQRPNALWLDYVLPVAPEQIVKARATGGKLSVSASNHRLAALIVMPAKDEAAFKKLCDDLRAQRQKVFYNALYFDPIKAPQKTEGDGPFALWVPGVASAIRPWTAPSPEERKTAALDLKGAPGQRVIARACVTAYEDLGTGDIELSDLKGPGTIPAAGVRRYYQNYRVSDTSVDEMALLPWTKIRFEPGISWAYWLWLEIPADAKPGAYKGALTFKADKGGSKTLPIELEVYPFKLDDNIPVSYGMYYGPWNFPAGFDRRKLLKEQHIFMREIGFTGTCVGTGSVKGARDGEAEVTFDPTLFEIAREVGMGRRPEQHQMGTTLGMARTIARRVLGMGAGVDQQPGSEMGKPELKGLYQSALRQYKAFIEKMGLPVAVESVDEPREVPNPWNRNLEHTNTYGDWIREVGLKTFVTPMSDGNSGKDYTSLVDHHDIISIHAWPASKKLIEKYRAATGKKMWFYNTGMDRLSWGFYAWRMGAVGRWEWHWCSPERGGPEGYPAPGEWYTPFNGLHAYANHAPYGQYAGGMLFKTALLTASQGITDYTYLYTLEQALEAAKADTGKAKAVEAGRALLDALSKSIPEFPKIKNMTSADAGALVGAGLDTPVAELTDAWQRKIAEVLKELKK